VELVLVFFAVGDEYAASESIVEVAGLALSGVLHADEDALDVLRTVWYVRAVVAVLHRRVDRIVHLSSCSFRFLFFCLARYIEFPTF
jgi:hypothetical protein